MSVKVKTTERGLVSPRDMEDGQIGVIVKWPGSNYIGTVVQAYEDYLISVGEYSLQRWSCRCEMDEKALLVRLLEPGETIEVVSNQ